MSVVNLDNAQLLDRRSLVRRVGTTRPATMRQICVALSIAAGCD
jgi:mRNA-degrading endonuclease toxin of MazEF toxin-antitoxin module